MCTSPPPLFGGMGLLDGLNFTDTDQDEGDMLKGTKSGAAAASRRASAVVSLDVLGWQAGAGSFFYRILWCASNALIASSCSPSRPPSIGNSGLFFGPSGRHASRMSPLPLLGVIGHLEGHGFMDMHRADEDIVEVMPHFRFWAAGRALAQALALPPPAGGIMHPVTIAGPGPAPGPKPSLPCERPECEHQATLECMECGTQCCKPCYFTHRCC